MYKSLFEVFLFFYFKNKTWIAKLNQNKKIKFNPFKL